MNERYAKARVAAYSGDVDLLSSEIRFVIVDKDLYTPDIDNDEFLADIPSGAVQSTSDLLTGKSITGVTFGADPIAFSDNPGSVGSPVSAELLILIIDTGSDATSRLIHKFDHGSNLPVTLNGSNITVIFPDGKIFDL
ncbi:hypothetical protein MINTMi198_17500 [Mycobacterium intracellulare M.i.198]|uniref:hypothetical protein n=1 Tax=Mycobacterium intracellulare TaxID=1767 RepID=UPI0002EB22D2|nr:hypothetical protein [Mycobacterium intracellulare]BCP36380.1 hypothetical protein MINTMi198_17500 [Mycobacterium intracellulare M.i.198]